MTDVKSQFLKVMAEPAGAQYYKVDLHIHTPSSADAQGKKRYNYNKRDAKKDAEQGYPRAKELAKQIVEQLVRERIQVAAFTDHNSPGYVDNTDLSSPSWFELVARAYKCLCHQDPDYPPLLLLPGVEITTDRIHVLGIFDNEDRHIIFKIASLLRSVDIREHEFGEVDGVFGTKTIWEVADAIDELGGICIPAHINARSMRALLSQYEPPDMEIERLVQHRAIHVFGVVPTTTPWPDHRTYQSIIANKTYKTRGGGKVGFHDWMVARRAEVPQHLPDLGYMMNSDAHEIAKIGKRYSWVRLDDLSFRSLASALRAPAYTIASNHLEPVSPIRSQVLGLSFEGGYADGLVVRFNEHFNCIVARPVTGKTTLMRIIHDTYDGRRMGLRIRDDTERAIEELARGLWDEMEGGEIFTQAGRLRTKLPEDVRRGFDSRFLETHDLPWSVYLYFAQVGPDGGKTIYAAERSRPAGGVDEDGREDVFGYYRSQPFPADLPGIDAIEFTELEHRDFRRSLARPGFHYDRITLGSPEAHYPAARWLLDRHLLRAIEGYTEARGDLFSLCRKLQDAAAQAPPDTAAIEDLVAQVRGALEALFGHRTAFAQSFNETEQEGALRIAFQKGRWQELVATVPPPEQVSEFVHNVRLSLHGQEYYDLVEFTFYPKKGQGGDWESVPYEQLEPGQRSLMALRLLLNSSRAMAPVFIDAPERWLDNESLLEYLELRRIRGDQLVLFTQNPNIAVLGNAEQNIILDRDEDRTVCVAAGGLEAGAVAEQIVKLLEGGKIAFERKLLRYRAELAKDRLRIELHRA